MANTKLSNAKNAKDDECYTRYEDIQREVNAYLDYDPNTFRNKTVFLPCDDPEWSNFTRFFAEHFESLGLKKLISTSYAIENKRIKYGVPYQLSLFETENPKFDENITRSHGKIFTLTTDTNKSGRIDIHDLEWEYLKGDGDFRSDEVKKLRDECDIIVTNPPFSLFSNDFLPWIMESGKKFLIIANKNCVTYKDVFQLIKMNRFWAGSTPWSGGMWFYTDIENSENTMKNVPAAWFTNMEHGRRHEPIEGLLTMEENLRFSRHAKIREQGYPKYDNYGAIEVPYTDAIPADYDGVMGVPPTFLEKYSPEQFEILGMCENLDLYGLKTKVYSAQECRERYFELFGKKGVYDLNAAGVVNGIKVYQRILIRRKKNIPR